ncbi:hypothetical protein RJ639_044013 [Escallonia herrerae]|uniref:C2H2-type domain-containing protein n=1 Tax=Escallonia herrerae TaxID=1293975 RepID=A0AA88WBZ8_9ASTE|nr:hypothetical protein RJ639_044013 [Escallonia herrerae]
MDPGNRGNSETSSDENDQPEKSADGTGRSYECTFCKRGFTNAQALGGHMNIHRKDKAKAKRQSQQPSFSSKINVDYLSTTNPRFRAPIPMEQVQYHAPLGAKMNHQFYYPAPNPSYPYAYGQSDFMVPSPDHLSLNEERLATNLSLRIGSSLMEDRKGKKKAGREDRMENEVDLELRLGHDP